MTHISDEALLQRVDDLVARFNEGVAAALPNASALGVVIDPKLNDADFFLGEVVTWCEDNILENYIGNAISLPKGNFLLYFVKARDFRGLQDTVRTLRESGTLTKVHARSLLASCLRYIRLELKRPQDEHEKRYLKAFATFISNRGAKDQFFPTGANIQTEYPMPKEVGVFDVGNPNSKETIPIDELLASIRSVKDRKDF